MERQTRILKGKSLKLDASQKIKPGNDGLSDVPGTEQLRIAQNAWKPQDIFIASWSKA